MTTGSYDNDHRAMGSDVTTIWPQGWVVASHAVYPGLRITKSWSGTDYPPNAKPVYQKFTWYRKSDGKKFTCKFRVDAPTRRKSVDHPYSCVYRFGTYSGGNGISTFDFGQLSESRTGCWAFESFNVGYYSPGTTNDWTTNDDIALLGRLRDKVAGSDFNMGVFLGEGHEALKMITGSAIKIRKSLTALKRGDLAGAASALAVSGRRLSPKKDIANNWLELQYGWLPLLKDTEGAAQFLAKLLNYPMVQTYMVHLRKNLGLVPWPSGGQVTTQWSAKGFVQSQIIARLTEVDPYQLSGLTDPASVAWELLPWSFVIDWFIPIGNYLAGRSLASALTGTFVTTKTRRINTSYGGGCYPTGSGSHSVVFSGDWSGYTTELNVDRTVSTSLAVPLPSFKTLDKVASWKHCANAVALLSQMKR